MLAVEADGASVTTVEGLAAGGPAPPAPAGVPRHRRGAVRVLHPGPAVSRRRRCWRDTPHPTPRRGRGGPRRQPVPLRRVRADHRGRPCRRRVGGRSGRDPGRSRRAMTGQGIGASPARVGGLDRVTGRQAYVADIRLEDALHVKLVTRRLRPGADRRDRHERGARGARRPPRRHRGGPAAADAALRAAVPGPAGARGRRDALPRRAGRGGRGRDASTPPRRRRGLVRVEYEELPAVFTIAAALDPDAPLVQDPALRPGDPLGGHERPARAPLRLGRRRRRGAADVVVEGTYTFPMVTQFAIEPHALHGRARRRRDRDLELDPAPELAPAGHRRRARPAARQGPRLRARPGRRRSAASSTPSTSRCVAFMALRDRPAGPPRPDARGDLPGRPSRRVGDPRPVRASGATAASCSATSRPTT